MAAAGRGGRAPRAARLVAASARKSDALVDSSLFDFDDQPTAASTTSTSQQLAAEEEDDVQDSHPSTTSNKRKTRSSTDNVGNASASTSTATSVNNNNNIGTSKSTTSSKRTKLTAAAASTSSSNLDTTTPVSDFRPRAAHQTRLPAPAFTAIAGGDDPDDPTSFAYNVNPPTPHASTSTNKTAAANSKKRKASPTKAESKGPAAKNPRKAAAPTPNPATSSSSGATSIFPSPPPNLPREFSNPIPVSETPVQRRNLAFRAGLDGEGIGLGLPGSAGGGSARRVSGGSATRGSVRRASSIAGFSGVPHIGVEDDRLYRSTNGDDPTAVRMRSVISWSSQRRRDLLFPVPSPSASSTTGANLSNTGTDLFGAGAAVIEVAEVQEEDLLKKMAREVVDQFIADLSEGLVDTSVHFDARESTEGLPPHPQNLINEAKLRELQDNFHAISLEQTSRTTLRQSYATLFSPLESLVPSTLNPGFDPTKIEFQVGLGMPETMEEALEVGKKLLNGEKGPKRKGKGRENPEAELEKRITDVRVQTANFHLLTHRHSSFATLASSYITSRVSESHGALSHISGSGSGRTGAERVGEDGRRGIGSLVGESGGTEGDDARDLMRAISRADSEKGPGRAR